MKITWEEEDIKAGLVAIAEDDSYTIVAESIGDDVFKYGLVTETGYIHGSWMNRKDMATHLNKINVTELQ